jgi:hypothetical protein
LNSKEKHDKTPVHKKNRGSVKHSRVDKSKDGKSYYYTKHGKNPTHNSEQCYAVKDKAAKQANGFNGKTMTKESFRRKINMMAKKSSKKKS